LRSCIQLAPLHHGKEQKNYIGESWITPPKDHKKENDHTYVPKRCIHTWSGHTKVGGCCSLLRLSLRLSVSLSVSLFFFLTAVDSPDP
jgi:hypothetical protein